MPVLSGDGTVTEFYVPYPFRTKNLNYSIETLPYITVTNNFYLQAMNYIKDYTGVTFQIAGTHTDLNGARVYDFIIVFG